jgi:hypothetical protein
MFPAAGPRGHLHCKRFRLASTRIDAIPEWRISPDAWRQEEEDVPQMNRGDVADISRNRHAIFYAYSQIAVSGGVKSRG